MIWDNPPHSCDLYNPATPTRDAGGGTTLAWPATATQSAVPCSINTASAGERELYAQMGVMVEYTVAFLSSAFTTAPVRGAKLVTTDTSETLHVKGIRSGRAWGGVPAFLYCDCSSQL